MAAELANKALELRKAGMTLQQISDVLGVAVSTIHKSISVALRKLNVEPAEEYRTMDLQRLDALYLAAFRQAKDGHLGAIDRCLRIMERRAKLLGLDSPTKFEGDVKNSGGVLLVPGAMTPEDWSKVAAAQQAALAAEPATDQDLGQE